MEEQLSRHYDRLQERDYNRSKAGLGSGGGPGASTLAPDGAAVAQHYNSLQDRHRTLTGGSDILHLRNLNNWIKSVLIGRYLKRGHSVLDLACGKGGDMLKFKAGGCAAYVGIDIAGQSVRDAVYRYNGANGRPGMNFPATFAVGDFCASDLDQTLPPQLRFHLVSCQFALHYSFSSEASALQLLRNVACRLEPGGVFVGTTTDANVLVRRLRAAPALTFGNDHYSVTFDAAHASKCFPAAQPFGIRYRFSLQEAVEDCEEFLVPFAMLVKLAERCGLVLESRHNFTDLFAAEWRTNKQLLDKMRVLPEHGAIADAEWEVAHSYLAFAFRRLGPDGKPPQRPPPTVRNTGHRPCTDAGLLWLPGGDGAPAPPGGGGAPSRKREQPEPGGNEREERRAKVQSVHQEKDALFD